MQRAPFPHSSNHLQMAALVGCGEQLSILRVRITKDTRYGNNSRMPKNGMHENTIATRNSVSFMNRIASLTNMR